MTKTHTILLTSLAFILALSVSASPALAENLHHLRAVTMPHSPMPDGVPNVTIPLVQQGPTAMGPTPPITNPPSWPCFPPNAPCSSDPAGGYLGALPTEVYAITTCETPFNSSTGKGGCGELWWTFQVDAALTCAASGCPLSVAINAKQGTSNLYTLPLTNIGSIPSPSSLGGSYTEVIYGQQGFGPNWDPTAVNPVAGNASITVTTQVTSSTGTKITAKGTAVVLLH